MGSMKLTLSLLPGELAICQLQADADVPGWAFLGEFTSVTRTADELSIVCQKADVPAETRCEMGWRCLKVGGPVDFSLTGVLASLTAPLAQAGIGIFVVSTFDTDYILIKEEQVDKAIEALSEVGHRFQQQAGRVSYR